VCGRQEPAGAAHPGNACAGVRGGVTIWRVGMGYWGFCLLSVSLWATGVGMIAVQPGAVDDFPGK